MYPEICQILREVLGADLFGDVRIDQGDDLVAARWTNPDEPAEYVDVVVDLEAREVTKGIGVAGCPGDVDGRFLAARGRLEFELFGARDDGGDTAAPNATTTKRRAR